MNCPGCVAGIPRTESGFHQWDDHKTKCERDRADESDFWCYDTDKLDYAKLDPGIREVVRFLISHGFRTTDSGDGKHKLERGWDEEEIVPFPHVYMQVEPSELVTACLDLRGLLRGIGIRVVSQTESWAEAAETDTPARPYIEAIYDPCGVALVGLFHVTSDMISNKDVG